MTLVPDPKLLGQEIANAIDEDTTERDLQSQAGIAGVSDIGHCREYLRLLTVETAFTDSPSKRTAWIGKELGEGLERVIVKKFPTARRNLTVHVKLPSGITLPGHPDIVTDSGVLDLKTTDGITMPQRNGAHVQQKFQRHLYAAALVQAGELPEDCWVGNAWFDRSGREDEIHCETEPYDPIWLDFADQWLDEVLYAVKTGQEAPKDQPMEFCRKCCEFFTVCRGNDALTDSEGGGLITDEEKIDAVRAYTEAREAKKRAQQQMDDAQRALADISGIAEGHVVKWIYVNESDVPGYTRRGYSKLDIRKIPRPK